VTKPRRVVHHTAFGCFLYMGLCKAPYLTMSYLDLDRGAWLGALLFPLVVALFFAAIVGVVLAALPPREPSLLLLATVAVATVLDGPLLASRAHVLYNVLLVCVPLWWFLRGSRLVAS
jgi:hypothetical protein